MSPRTPGSMLRTLADGLRAATLRAPRGHALPGSAGAFVALVAIYLVISLLIDALDSARPWRFVRAGVVSVLADCLLTYAAGWLLAQLARCRELATGVATTLLAATVMVALVVHWPLRHLTALLQQHGHPLVAVLPALAGRFWWLLVLLVLAHWLMPLRLGRSLFGALLAFVVSGAAWWWLPSAALVDTRVVATPAPADAPPALPAPVSAPQPATDEPDFDPEQVMYAQAALLDAELARLAPRTPGKINLYVVAFAGDAGEDVFHNEVEYVRTLFEQRFDAAGHVVVLQNNPRTLERAPLASWTSLHASLQAIAQRADPAQDIVLLYLTSHGSDDHELLVQMDPLPLVQLYPEDVADAFRTQPALRWRVVIVNACYSGGFIEALRDDSTLVMTSARRDRTSFGCGSDADITWFGKALLVDALNRTTSLPEAFALARDWVAQREAADPAADGTVEHSEPQLATSPSIEARLARWSAALPPRPPVEFKPAARR